MKKETIEERKDKTVKEIALMLDYSDVDKLERFGWIFSKQFHEVWKDIFEVGK